MSLAGDPSNCFLRLTDSILVPLTYKCFRNMLKLDLSGNKITEVAPLFKAKGLNVLEELVLDRNSVVG